MKVLRFGTNFLVLRPTARPMMRIRRMRANIPARITRFLLWPKYVRCGLAETSSAEVALSSAVSFGSFGSLSKLRVAKGLFFRLNNDAPLPLEGIDMPLKGLEVRKTADFGGC